MLIFYLPGSFQKGVASQIIARFSFFFKLALNNILSRDSGMVSSSHPQSIVTLHPVVANDNILQSIVQTVSHVQNSGNIRRRNHYRINAGFSTALSAAAFFKIFVYRRLFIACRLKIAVLFPFVINSVFKIFRIISFF